jgi:hypothetical protein
LTNFPMCDGSPPAPAPPEDEQPTLRPITVGGKVRWINEPYTQDDADPDGAGS